MQPFVTFTLCTFLLNRPVYMEMRALLCEQLLFILSGTALEALCVLFYYFKMIILFSLLGLA